MEQFTLVQNCDDLETLEAKLQMELSNEPSRKRSAPDVDKYNLLDHCISVKKSSENITPFLMTPLAIDSCLKMLLERAVASRMYLNPIYQNIQYHRRHLLRDVASWLNVSLDDPDIEKYHDELIALFHDEGGSKNPKFIPRNETTWVKLLQNWIRQNMYGYLVKDRNIYRLLAVDGFRGFESKHLKLYLTNVIQNAPLRRELKRHNQAVRCIYEWFDQDKLMSSLTGTHTACIVFLTLIRLYKKQVAILDDIVRMMVNQAEISAESFLHRDSDYYKLLKNVNEQLLDTCEQIYIDAFLNWQSVSMELLNELSERIIIENEKEEKNQEA